MRYSKFSLIKKNLKSRFLEYVVALHKTNQGEKSREDKEINFCSSKKAYSSEEEKTRMKAIQPSSKKELLWKCREHPHLLCDFIALDENTKYRFLCFNCMKKSPIPTSHMISMNFILKA